MNSSDFDAFGLVGLTLMIVWALIVLLLLLLNVLLAVKK